MLEKQKISNIESPNVGLQLSEKVSREAHYVDLHVGANGSKVKRKKVKERYKKMNWLKL